MNPLKFGIIGCSKIAKRSVIPAILESKFAEDFNQNTFDEINRLKKEQNIN